MLMVKGKASAVGKHNRVYWTEKKSPIFLQNINSSLIPVTHEYQMEVCLWIAITLDGASVWYSSRLYINSKWSNPKNNTLNFANKKLPTNKSHDNDCFSCQFPLTVSNLQVKYIFKSSPMTEGRLYFSSYFHA